MYDEFMQNDIGYQINDYQNTYGDINELYSSYYNRNIDYLWPYKQSFYQKVGLSKIEIEEFYPEIYKVIYPMVKKVCKKNNRSITEEVIENMVNEVYNNIDNNNEINVNITLNNDVKGERQVENRNQNDNNRDYSRNSSLLDIIKILVLRELLDRQKCYGPNCRPHPPRPHYPVAPPMNPYYRYD